MPLELNNNNKKTLGNDNWNYHKPLKPMLTNLHSKGTCII
jgi:hypothetical protein